MLCQVPFIFSTTDSNFKLIWQDVICQGQMEVTRPHRAFDRRRQHGPTVSASEEEDCSAHVVILQWWWFIHILPVELKKQPFCTTIRRVWTICFRVDWTETWYQPFLCLQSGRSFHVVFWLFHSSVVLSCHRILLILEKYNITKRIKFIFLAINTFF